MSSTSDTASALRRISPNALGAIYMVIGSLGYVTNDALVRVATDEGLGVYQALCLRGLAMTVLFAALVRARRRPGRPSRLTPPVVARVGAEVVSTALFFAALVHLEFATAQTILLLVPFTVTLVAALVLGESVTAGQYATVVAGFVGVLLVVQPGTGDFSAWSLAVVGAAVSLTFREFATRRIDGGTSATFVALATSVAITVMTGVLAAVTEWNAVSARGAAAVGLACLCLVVGYVFTIQTVRVGDLSVSAPFRYTTLVGAVILGAIFFDETPGLLTVAGCLIIVVSGIVAIHLERTSGRSQGSLAEA
ncbi:MAG: DMT family transporter [Actinomycetota bacterium]